MESNVINIYFTKPNSNGKFYAAVEEDQKFVRTFGLFDSKEQALEEIKRSFKNKIIKEIYDAMAT